MKLLTATVISLSLLASASAQTNQAGAVSGTGAATSASVQDAQTIKITRSGSQPSRQAPAENFTGSVSVEPLFQANDPARAFGARVTFEPGARMALPSARPDPDRDGGHQPGAALGRPGRGDPARRRRLDSARPKTLARSLGKHRNDAHRHYGTARRQDRRMDGKGQRRAVPHADPCSRGGIRCACKLCLWREYTT
jgi:hypothetical protein